MKSPSPWPGSQPPWVPQQQNPSRSPPQFPFFQGIRQPHMQRSWSQGSSRPTIIPPAPHHHPLNTSGKMLSVVMESTPRPPLIKQGTGASGQEGHQALWIFLEGFCLFSWLILKTESSPMPLFQGQELTGWGGAGNNRKCRWV